ncbi:MAG: hypothetical protein HFI10_12745 [Lachnospiraceae bacterium]|nr:hypothetical protein [Lachnospiraceae bacterium]
MTKGRTKNDEMAWKSGWLRVDWTVTIRTSGFRVIMGKTKEDAGWRENFRI